MTDEISHYMQAVSRLKDRERALEAAIRDIDAHATPLGEDGDGFVTTGYLVSVGAMHRALGVLNGASVVTVHQIEMLAAITVIPAWCGAVVYSYRRWQHADRQYHADSHQSHIRLVHTRLFDQDEAG